MRGNDTVLNYLNRYLTIELSGHKQYLWHARVCRQWGLHGLATVQQEYSAEETRHAGRLLDRLLFLGGKPVMEDARTPLAKASVPEQLESDHGLVGHALTLLDEAVACCEECGDYVSRDLFQEMLADEQQHLHWLEQELGQIEWIGLENYLQARMSNRSEG